MMRYTPEIVNSYLYAQATEPENRYSGNLLRPEEAKAPPVSVDAAWVMSADGPGRFAVAAQSELVDKFFAHNATGEYLYEIPPDRKTTGRVIANFRQVVKTGEIRMHPHISGLLDSELLEKLKLAQSTIE